MNKRQFEVFLEEVIKGDGSCYKHTENAYILYGKSDFLDSMQILCILNGMRATVVNDNRGNPRLNISRYENTEFDTYLYKQEEEYHGMVWCLNVPYTNFMVRRNGRHFFTGNCWLTNWLAFNESPNMWLQQGGLASRNAYLHRRPELRWKHYEFFHNKPYYFIDENNNLFVHGGLMKGIPLKAHDTEDLLWNRSLFSHPHQVEEFNRVFIGHTPTSHIYHSATPVEKYNVVMMDTGAGYDGGLSFYDFQSNEFLTTPPSAEFYKGMKGR